jgi:Uma2 family endonuclease
MQKRPGDIPAFFVFSPRISYKGTMTAELAPVLLKAADFLEIDFGPDRKAELDGGFIRMMAGGTRAHARVQANFMGELRNRLRGSGCRPYGSDMAIRIDDFSVRYPDLSVVCDTPSIPADDKQKAFDAPVVVIEILSPSTSAYDQSVKLKDYQSLASVDTIVFADPDTERCRIVQRIGPHGWRDERFDDPVDVALPKLNLTLVHAEIFARD